MLLSEGNQLCRGNSGGQWLSEGYDPIAEQLCSELKYDTFLLEYDSDPAGGFEPLRFMPRDKTVVLGLITTKSGELECPSDLLHRIDDAARYVPMENLALSPQCGFASSIPGIGSCGQYLAVLPGRVRASELSAHPALSGCLDQRYDRARHQPPRQAPWTRTNVATSSRQSAHGAERQP